MGITRKELFEKLGIVKSSSISLDKWTDKAYRLEEEKKWKENSYFISSFHASSYPGALENCRCKSLYKLMNVPEPEPIRPEGIAIMEVGKAIEEQIVSRWEKLGITLGPQQPEQLKMEFEDLWLSGYIDAVLDLRPEYDRVLPVEIKTKNNSVIEYMKVGGQEYEEQHYYQLQSYILWCIENHVNMGWDKLGLKPAVGGIIYYVSREKPRNTHEFFVEFNKEVTDRANEILKFWKQCFLDDILPERPKEYMWSSGCCKWNPYKKLCKEDVKDGIVKLSQSNAVKFAKQCNPEYSVEDIRAKVKDRWRINES